MPLPAIDGVVRLRVLVDRGSVELFGNSGRVAWCIAAIQDKKGIDLSAQGGTIRVESLEAWSLRSSWR